MSSAWRLVTDTTTYAAHMLLEMVQSHYTTFAGLPSFLAPAIIDYLILNPYQNIFLVL